MVWDGDVGYLLKYFAQELGMIVIGIAILFVNPLGMYTIVEMQISMQLTQRREKERESNAQKRNNVLIF